MSAEQPWPEQAQQIARLIEGLDHLRLDTEGGYPSAWTIRWGHVIIAEIDHRGAPILTICPCARFIKEANELLGEIDS